MPTLSEFQDAVRQSLQTSSWVIASDADQSEQRAKDIVLEFAERCQQETPQLNVYKALTHILKRAIVEVIPWDTSPKEIGIHKGLQQKLKMLSAPGDEAEISAIRAEMDAILRPRLVRWFQLELAECIFVRLTLDLHIKGDAGWWGSFIQIPSIDVAFLISQFCYEIIEHGWQIPDESTPLSLFNWMKDQAALADEKQHGLFRLGEFLSDNMVLFAIPDTPRFCLKSDGKWCILDSETIVGSQESYDGYRQILAQIEGSGPTGIGYEIANLSADTEVLNKVLIAWHRNFPMEAYEDAETETLRQEILGNHERWIDRADACLDLSVWRTLPEEVRQIPNLTKELRRNERLHAESVRIEQEHQAALAVQLQLQTEKDGLLEEAAEEEFSSDQEERLEEIEADLARLDADIQYFVYKIEENGLSEGIAAEVTLIIDQLENARTIRDAVDVAALKLAAFEGAKIDIVISEGDEASSAVLLNHNQDSDACVLEEPQLLVLVNQAVDDLVVRGYRRKEQQPGQLRRHLDACREQQDKSAFECRGNLRTECSDDGNYYIITAGRIRDPIDRRLYIDVATSTDGRDFCDVIIGGCLWAIVADPSLILPENIQNFLAEQQPGYPDRAKLKFEQFRSNKLELPSPEQMAILAPYISASYSGLLAAQGLFAPQKHPAPAAPTLPLLLL